MAERLGIREYQETIAPHFHHPGVILDRQVERGPADWETSPREGRRRDHTSFAATVRNAWFRLSPSYEGGKGKSVHEELGKVVT